MVDLVPRADVNEMYMHTGRRLAHALEKLDYLHPATLDYSNQLPAMMADLLRVLPAEAARVADAMQQLASGL